MTRCLRVVAVAAAVSSPNLCGQVRPGIDVLVESEFAPLAGKRIGLVMNQSAAVRGGEGTTLDAFIRTHRCKVVALFAPEHGIDGKVPAGALVSDVVEPRTGLAVRSLYGAHKKPTPKMLEGLDVIVYDIQDIGVRSYTFISTLVKVMEGCADAGVPLVVLDRPNPIGGDVIDGPVLDTVYRSFVGIVPIPYIHGLTVGELARMANGEGWLEGGRRCDLTVIRMQGWRRTMTWDDTGLRWVATSPNIQSAASAFCNGITGAIGDLRLVNIGIGSPLAFQIVAKEWIDGSSLAAWLNELGIPGLVFRDLSLQGTGEVSNLTSMNGVRVVRTGERTRPFAAQIALLTALRDLYGSRVSLGSIPEDRWRMFDKVCGTARVRHSLLKGDSWGDIAESWDGEIRAFIERREDYLLYE